jgi:hypothetical protein
VDDELLEELVEVEDELLEEVVEVDFSLENELEEFEQLDNKKTPISKKTEICRCFIEFTP